MVDVKYNPVLVKKFLFGGGYHAYGDPYNGQVMEGFNTFCFDEFPETYENLQSFKKSIEHVLDQFGYNEEVNLCEDLTEMEVDTNQKHHKFKMPSDETIKAWYKEQLLDHLDDLNSAHLKSLRSLLTLREFKHEAFKLKEEENIKHSEALEVVARKYGYQHFHEAQKNLD